MTYGTCNSGTMRTFLLGFFIFIGSAVAAQRNCGTYSYTEGAKLSNSVTAKKLDEVEQFIRQQIASASEKQITVFPVIKIPVVVHVLYNNDGENISDAQIQSQIEALNKDYRRQNADTASTPDRFKSVAADAQIEFHLATADPNGRATTGIVRKRTQQTYWMSDDKIKFSLQGGDNAWDCKSYLNIWIGDLRSALGYATAPGSDASRDGVVINYTAFGTINTAGPYDRGRTATHEIGHWLGLKHIWGDNYCGDDLVADTPPQGGYTAGCPNGFRSSCNNGSLGDMYMNYMDFTNDACMNLFTEGQKQRMRALFAEGGPRASILTSKGLSAPWNATPDEIVLPTVNAHAYPNPATSEVTLNFGSDDSWVGQKIQIININGIVLQSLQVSSKSQKLSIAALQPGMYFIKAENGSQKFMQKLVKL